jgi:hypothetical protein
MTEQPRTMKIVLERTAEMVQKDAEISKLNQELGKMQELNKALLSQDVERERQKAIRVNEPAPAPLGDPTQTAPLYDPKQRFVMPLDEESQVLDIASFPSEEQAILFLKACADNPNCGDYKLASAMYSRAIKRCLKEGGCWEFQGNTARYELKDGHVVKGIRPKTFRKVED